MMTKEEIKKYRDGWRHRNKERLSAQFKKWYHERSKGYYAKNIDRIRSNKSKWLKTEKGKKYASEHTKRYVARYPEKNSARRKLREAVKSGEVIRKPCEVCGNLKTDGHHEDYSKPLDVRWLCVKHHQEIHHPPKPSV